VSRAVIRKVFFRLAQRSVVELRPNRGAIVARPSVAETRMVFDTRRLIEKEIIALVAARGTKEQVRLLRAALRDEQRALSEGDRHKLLRLTGAFHVRLAEFTGNTILAGVVTDLVSRTSLIIALYEAHGSVACRSQDHAVLVECVEKREPERAARALIVHLNDIEGRLNLNKPAGHLNLTEVFGGATP
jgi:DNA-binding GntR family transcriptional regulator